MFKRATIVAAGVVVGLASVLPPGLAAPHRDPAVEVRNSVQQPRAGSQHLGRDTQGRTLVYVDGAAETVLRTAVGKVGGTVAAAVAGRVKAAVPATRIAELAALPGVSEVRLPDRAVPMAVTSEGVTASRAALWHQDGKKGAGVKVGVIDVGFGGLQQAQQSGDLPGNDRIVVNSSNCLDTGLSDDHGTNVAEVIHDMAPAANLYLACVEDTISFAAAADWLRQQGVQIITSSLGFLTSQASRGDGTGQPGSPADIVRRAREAGILWVSAAGNQARMHYAGTAADRTGDSWVEFTNPGESAGAQGNGFPVPWGSRPTVGLRWDAWPTTTKDLDLYVMKTPNPPSGPEDPNIAAKSTRSQAQSAGGLSPTEEVTFTNSDQPAQTRTYYVYVKNNNAPFTTGLELFVGGVNANVQLQRYTEAGSVVEPASSPFAIAVGASAPGSGVVQNYSSRGPSIDGRTKPDLTGFDAVTTATYGNRGFTGTSAAAAHVAGAAAVFKAANPALDAAQLHTALTSRAKRTSINNTSGHGFLDLGTPDAVPATNPAGYTPLVEPRRIHSRAYTPGELITVPVADVPGDATAVAVNITARSDTDTSVDVFPTDPAHLDTRATTLRVRPGGGFTAVMTVATLGPDRAIRVRNQSGNTWVIADVLGYFSPTSAANYITRPVPQRILDTRGGFGATPRTGPLGPGEVYPLAVRGVAGVPASATAVAVSITASEASEETFLSAYTLSDPSTSTLNLSRDDRRTNTAIVALAEDGTIKLRNDRGMLAVAVDVIGWFAPDPGARYVPLPSPTRVVDTASGTGLRQGPLGHGEIASFALGGTAGVSARATGAVVTTTATEDLIGSQLSVYPTDVGWSPVTTMGLRQGQTLASTTLLPLGATGKMDVRNERGHTQLATDVLGYFVDGTPATSAGACPTPRGELGFTPIFDARIDSSYGWQSTSDTPLRRDGCDLITGGSDSVYWFAGATYNSSYTLKTEWKATGANSDSGVLVALAHPGNHTNPEPGLEVRIGTDNSAGAATTGAITGLQAPTSSPVRPRGEWNTYEITVEWNRITVTLNGQRINDYIANPSTVDSQRLIGLHSRSGSDPVHFRNIRVKHNAATGVGSFVGINTKCLDNSGNATNNIAYLWSCYGGEAQTWTMPGDGTIRNADRCLDVENGATANGSRAGLYPCNDWNAQQWLVRTDGSLLNTRSGKCLTATGTSDRAPVTIEPCARTAEQTWRWQSQPAIAGALVNATGKCLDVVNGAPDATETWLWDCHGGFAQAWRLVADGTVRAFSRCLDVTGGAVTPGTRVGFAACNTSPAQQWELRPDASLINPKSGLCATAATPDTRAAITLQKCDRTPLQTWRLSAQSLGRGTMLGWVVGEPGGKCLDVVNGDPATNAVWMWQCAGTPAQVWYPVDSGTIRAFGKCLDINFGGTTNHTKVGLYDCNGVAGQQWVFRPNGTVVNPVSGRCLDASNRADTVVIYDCHGARNQRWALAARPS